MEVTASNAHFLGMPVEAFLEHYWQKKPLLIRQAFPGFSPPLSPEDLAGLACEQGPLSRLVTYHRKKDQWHLRTGPFEEAEFPELGRRDWTLLIQDMDKWDADVAELLRPFAFLPRWRIDDVMISFAVEGGSVGPHIDQYDVFLVQGMGHRHWQIETQARHEPAFREDAELKLLVEFKADAEWELAPGDVLYLPPGYAHHGVARDNCMTFSVGMRAPSSAEMLIDFAEHLAQQLPEYQRFQDPDLSVATDPFEIDDRAFDRVDAVLSAWEKADSAERRRWFGQFITRYRSAGDIQAAPDQPDWQQALTALSAGQCLQRHPFARFAWAIEAEQALLHVSGESFHMPAPCAQKLCAHAQIDADTLRQLSTSAQSALQHLLLNGVYQLAEAE